MKTITHVALMSIPMLVACGSGGGNSPSPDLPEPTVLLRVNFDDNPIGRYSHSDLYEDFGETASDWNDGIDEARVEISVANPSSEAHGLRVTYPVSEFGTKKTGAQFKVFFEPRDTLCASYKLYFPPDFLFTGKGFKLPGVAGGQANTGGHPDADGVNGFSSRLMVRETALYQYTYLFQDETGLSPSSGHYIAWSVNNQPVNLSSGTHHIETCVGMNSISADGTAVADGTLTSYIDGVVALDLTNLKYRSSLALQSDVFYFSSFYGGSSVEWNSPANQWITFSDIVISTEPITSILQ